MCDHKQAQRQTQGIRTSDHTETQISKATWEQKYDSMFDGLQFSRTQEIPEHQADELLREDTSLVAGRRIGSMEMTKARREYRGKRKKAISRKQCIDKYYDRINQEEAELTVGEEYRELDTYAMTRLLGRKEDQQRFIDGYTSGNPEEVRQSLETYLSRMMKEDISVFKYKSEDDLFKDYEKKMRIIEAGAVMKKALARYLEVGGAVDETRRVEILARADFYEQMKQLYDGVQEKTMHPQNWFLRDDDLKKLSDRDLAERIQHVNLQIVEEKERNNGDDSNRSLRLKNLRHYLQVLQAEKLRIADGQSKTLKPKEDPQACLERLRKGRIRQSEEQWRLNLSDCMQAEAVHLAKRDELFEAQKIETEDGTGYKLGLPVGSTWIGAGVNDRPGTWMSMVHLVYLNQYGKKMEDLWKEENQAEIAEVWDYIRGVLMSQKSLKEDDSVKESPEVLGELSTILRSMIRGMLRQFSVVNGEALYQQFDGVSTTGSLEADTLHEGWGQRFALFEHICSMAQDVVQIAELNENVTRMALQGLTPVEIRQYQQVILYLGNVGMCVENMMNALKSCAKSGDVLPGADEITPEVVRTLLGREVDEESGQVQKTKEGCVFRGITMFINSLSGGEKINRLGASAETPAAWQLTDPIGMWPFIFSGINMHVLEEGDIDISYYYPEIISTAATFLQQTKESDLGNEIRISKTMKIQLNEDGSVKQDPVQK